MNTLRTATPVLAALAAHVWVCGASAQVLEADAAFDPAAARAVGIRMPQVQLDATGGLNESVVPGALGDPSLLVNQRPNQLHWRSSHREFQPVEGLATALGAGAITLGLLLPETHSQANWQGGVGFDDASRSALMLRSRGAREAIAGVSDGLLLTLTAVPLVVDAIFTAWLMREAPEVATQMILIDISAHAIAQGLTTVVKRAVRRERPLGRACREDASRSAEDCGGGDGSNIEAVSFFSGHSSLAFTSAALICLHHTELGLLGEAGDAAMCATGLALAGGVAAMRVMSDRHYATDVLVGAGVGLLSGWLVPWLFNYMTIGDPQSGSFAAVMPEISSDRAGLNVAGTF